MKLLCSYMKQQFKIYGGIKPENYMEWVLPKSEEMLRGLKPISPCQDFSAYSASFSHPNTFALDL